MATKYLASVVFLVELLASQPAVARDYAQLIPQDPGSQQLMSFLKHGDEKAKVGQCVQPPKGDPAKILASAGVKTINARPGEVAALARGIQHIQELSGGVFKAIRGAKVLFRDSRVKGTGVASGGWNGQFIHIDRSGSKPDTNVAHLMHELGHYVGNQDNLYANYREQVPHPCQYTYRCRHVLSKGSARNEEFAEVFAAFLLHPELLPKSGPNCQKAYNFFANQVFKKGRELARCGAKPNDVPVAKPNELILAASQRSEKKTAIIPVPMTRPSEIDSENEDIRQASSEQTVDGWRGPSTPSNQLVSFGQQLKKDFPQATSPSGRTQR